MGESRALRYLTIPRSWSETIVNNPAWDGRSGTAGGTIFGAALGALLHEKNLDVATFAAAADDDAESVAATIAGELRVSSAALARYATALKLKPLEFLQKTGLLSLDVYAMGLDPLYFLPPGGVRYDARIYMREINPRHAVPERDMFVRNPVFKALLDDTVLDDLGKLEVQLTYLLRAASSQTGGTL
jgi:hypothetical protein